MSYLLFTPKYTRALIDIGYNDANRRIDEIEDFIYSPPNGDGPVKSKAPVATMKRPSSIARSNH
jgi:hypothetical protein